MERFIKGDIVVVPLPFSDLSNYKKRPALVIATLKGDDLILCQITSQSISDEYAIVLSSEDLVSGNLKRKSNIRPNRIFTADGNIILYKVGNLKESKMTEVISKLIAIVRN